MKHSILEQAKLTAHATAEAMSEGAKLTKDLAYATYEAGKELV